MTSRLNPGVASALGAALLFGASTPFAKILLGSIPPVMLAALFYLGSGIGLALILAIRGLRAPAGILTLPSIKVSDAGWLAGAILSGGVLGPVLLMFGLQQLDAAETSLLLNLEGVFTALLAWFAFHENFDGRIVAGMALIVAGGVVLSWDSSAIRGSGIGILLVVAACACWALDNNLTRKAAANDALVIACAKGLCAGAVNFVIAARLGAVVPPVSIALQAMTLGLIGYGASLALFVLALRALGSARTGAYFSVAPFFGAALSIGLHQEVVSVPLVAAGVLMGLGVWLHLTERHRHAHTHEPLAHEHSHVHDEHHRHEHPPGIDPTEPHSHPHEHAPVRHAHSHYPDMHHRHRH